MNWGNLSNSHRLMEGDAGGGDGGQGGGGGSGKGDAADAGAGGAGGTAADSVDLLDSIGLGSMAGVKASEGAEGKGAQEAADQGKGADAAGAGGDGGDKAKGTADAGDDAGAGAADESAQLIASLQAQLTEMSGKLAAMQSGGAAAAANADADKAGAGAAAADGKGGAAAEDIVSEYFPDAATFDKALDDPKEMNKILSKVRSDAQESVMRTIPAIIGPLVEASITVQTAKAKFYTDNADLADKAQFVGFVANDLMGKNPDWKIDKLFSELGKEVRTRLGLKEKAADGDRKGAGARPAFVPKGGGGRGAGAADGQQDLSPLEREIQDLIP